MKLTAILILFVINLLATPAVFASIINDVNIKSSGESSKVDVKIDNKVNTGNSFVSTKTASSKTSVEINQTGEGTSEVNINGKQWKLEGPGNISAPEETLSPSPTSTPAAIPTSIPDQVEKEIRNQIEQIIGKLKDLLDKLF